MKCPKCGIDPDETTSGWCGCPMPDDRVTLAEIKRKRRAAKWKERHAATARQMEENKAWLDNWKREHTA